MIVPSQPVSVVIPDSSGVATTAPVPRSVPVSDGSAEGGSTTVPVIRMVRVHGPAPGDAAAKVTRTLTVWPTERCRARSVCVPSAISPGPDGRRPVSAVR